jgi:hypothetical protein
MCGRPETERMVGIRTGFVLRQLDFCFRSVWAPCSVSLASALIQDELLKIKDGTSSTPTGILVAKVEHGQL